jgi:shikimate kinase
MTRETGPHRPCVVLVGPPGAGKSTIGRKLARELGADLVDTDAVIESETGRTIPEIFAADGEPEFRRIEEDVVRRAVEAGDGIVSLGGGAILSSATRALLRERTVVYLEISVAEGLRRTGAATHRPLLAGADPSAKYRELMQIRRPLYREVASVRVRTDGRSPGRVVRNILARLGLEPVEQVITPPRPAGTSEATAARRARRRRRGGRSRNGSKTAPQAISPTAPQPTPDTASTENPDPAESGASRTGATAAGDGTNSRRSRRSRRGGRRRAKSQRPATTPESTESQSGPAAAQPNTEASAPRRRGATRASSGAPQQSRTPPSRTGTRTTPPLRSPAATTGEAARTNAAQPRTTGPRRSRAARRPAGPPTSRSVPDPGAPDTHSGTPPRATPPDAHHGAPADEHNRTSPGLATTVLPGSVPDTAGGQHNSDDLPARSRWARSSSTLRAQQESEQTA